MSKPWETLTPRERDARCAEILKLPTPEEWGTVPLHDWQWTNDNEYNEAVCTRCGRGGSSWTDAEVMRQRDPGPCDIPPPRYTASLDAARLLLDEVKRQGKENKYIHNLARIATHLEYDVKQYGWHVEASDLWLFAFATADQQCHAACSALEGGEG